ncbi:hypothetical protein BpHYR1_004068, partial [Brachionus plicatilis]
MVEEVDTTVDWWIPDNVTSSTK